MSYKELTDKKYQYCIVRLHTKDLEDMSISYYKGGWYLQEENIHRSSSEGPNLTVLSEEQLIEILSSPTLSEETKEELYKTIRRK